MCTKAAECIVFYFYYLTLPHLLEHQSFQCKTYIHCANKEQTQECFFWEQLIFLTLLTVEATFPHFKKILFQTWGLESQICPKRKLEKMSTEATNLKEVTFCFFFPLLYVWLWLCLACRTVQVVQEEIRSECVSSPSAANLISKGSTGQDPRLLSARPAAH